MRMRTGKHHRVIHFNAESCYELHSKLFYPEEGRKPLQEKVTVHQRVNFRSPWSTQFRSEHL